MKISRLLAILVFLSLASVNSYAQKSSFDTVSRAKRYAELVTKFNAEPKGKKEFIFLGNSITAGTNWSKLLNLPNAVNRGISGDITFGVLERLQEVIDRKPAKIFILIGINDVAKNIPDSLIVRNHKKIIERIRTGSKKTQIYFYTLLPVNETFAKTKNHYGKDDHILNINNQIRGYAAKNVTIIDLYQSFIDENNRLKADLTKDGLHLIPAGYNLWADILNSGGYLK